MKKILIFIHILYLSLFIVCCKNNSENIELEQKTDLLKIYCYESFVTSGLSEKVISDFENKYSCQVDLKIISDKENILNIVINEKNSPQADIVIGIKNTQLYKALDTDVFLSYEPANIHNVSDKNLLLDKKNSLIPYSYSYFAFLYDSGEIDNPPITFASFQGSTYRDKIILTNPNESVIGNSMILITSHLYRENGFDTFWLSIKNNIYHLYNNWTEAFTAFQAGEAPIILSNTTKVAYFYEIEETEKYQVFIPKEGSFKEIDYIGILKGSQNLFLARRFIDYTISADFQEYIPYTIWMYPVIKNINLPAGFDECPVPVNDLTEYIFDKKDLFSDKWIELWTKIMSGR